MTIIDSVKQAVALAQSVHDNEIKGPLLDLLMTVRETAVEMQEQNHALKERIRECEARIEQMRLDNISIDEHGAMTKLIGNVAHRICNGCLAKGTVSYLKRPDYNGERNHSPRIRWECGLCQEPYQ